MSHVVMLGGFTESRRVLAPVADEAVEQGFGHDAEVLALREAWTKDDEALRSLMAGAVVVTHSAGLVALPDMSRRSNDSELPAELVVVAGPEPRPPHVLEIRAARKTMDHIVGETDHQRRRHLSVVAGNAAEFLAHPIVNSYMASAISNFSTMMSIDTGRAAAAGNTGTFMMEDDIFYRNPHWRNYAVLQDFQERGYAVDELPGGHDELLIDPAAVFQGIRQSFDSIPA